MIPRPDIDPRSLRVLIDGAAHGVLIESGERIVYINRCYAELLGEPTPANLLEEHVATIIAEDDAHRLLEFGRLRSASEPAPTHYDFVARRRDGHRIRLNASVSASVVAGRPFILSIVRPAAANDLSFLRKLEDPLKKLSKRETQVFHMLMDGRRLKEIALELEISTKTVSTHRIRLLQKLRVADNRGLFEYAVRHGLIDWSS